MATKGLGGDSMWWSQRGGFWSMDTAISFLRWICVIITSLKAVGMLALSAHASSRVSYASPLQSSLNSNLCGEIRQRAGNAHTQAAFHCPVYPIIVQYTSGQSPVSVTHLQTSQPVINLRISFCFLVHLLTVPLPPLEWSSPHRSACRCDRRCCM